MCSLRRSVANTYAAVQVVNADTPQKSKDSKGYGVANVARATDPVKKKGPQSVPQIIALVPDDDKKAPRLRYINPWRAG